MDDLMILFSGACPTTTAQGQLPKDYHPWAITESRSPSRSTSVAVVLERSSSVVSTLELGPGFKNRDPVWQIIIMPECSLSCAVALLRLLVA